MPVLSVLLPLPYWGYQNGSVMEDVSVARDLPFKLSLGGEREILEIGRNCLIALANPKIV